MYISLKIFSCLPLARTFIAQILKYVETVVEALKFYLYYLNGGREVVLVIDSLCSPPTFGDIGFGAMLGRYFLTLNLNVYFYIVEGQYRSDWLDLPPSAHPFSLLIKQQKKIVNFVLCSDSPRAMRVEWKSLIHNLNTKHLSAFVPYNYKIFRRCAVYHDYGRLLSMLFNRFARPPKSKFLLSASEFLGQIDLAPPPEIPYITVACRYSKYWAPDRNLSDEEFLSVVRLLQFKFPGHQIMVVSCGEGCDYFKNVSSANSLRLIFSKDFSSNFLGDVGLVLRSKFFYILKGGGISFYAQCSNVPFECYQAVDRSLVFRSRKLFPWNSSSQLFFATNYSR